jgi:hypothetical protein
MQGKNMTDGPHGSFQKRPFQLFLISNVDQFALHGRFFQPSLQPKDAMYLCQKTERKGTSRLERNFASVKERKEKRNGSDTTTASFERELLYCLPSSNANPL